MPFTASAYEEPVHTVVLKDGKFQLREYEPMIVAEVDVRGDLGEASYAAFNPLAGFISGNNTRSEKIEMTAPVTRTASQKIEMTAPVTRVETDNDRWTVAFIMPDEWTMETLPVPKNEGITIREEPGKLYATIRFSGRASERKYRNKEEELNSWLEEQGFKIAGAALYAGYNSPFTPGPFRRNEVMIPVEKGPST